MSRPIEFRGKRTDDSEWIIGCLTRYSKKISYITVDLIKNEVYKVYTDTVGLFTGLIAKKKKKHLDERIWEGDVFRSEKDFEGRTKICYSVIMWIDQRAAFYLVPVEHYLTISSNDVSEDPDFEWLYQDANLYDFAIDCGLTKVGNIHDNPEFLKP